MTQVDAARVLSDYFYEWVRSHANPGPDDNPNLIPHVRTPAGALRLPTKCTPEDMQRRRDEIGIPTDFRFAWFDLPVGAHYVRRDGDAWVRDGDTRLHPMAGKLSAERIERVARAVAEREKFQNGIAD